MNVIQTRLDFFHGNVRLAGRLFRNTGRLDVRQSAVIVTGSWLTVKEQMAELYAICLAKRGYTAFTFDFTGFGESQGEPRQAEIPRRKVGDLIAAADFVSSLSIVNPHAVSHLAVCASAQYGLTAIARGSRASRFISVAGWYHDTTTVAPFYGGLTGVGARLDTAQSALERYATSGSLDIVPAYEAGNTEAGMFFEADYYANPRRGAVAAWKNEMAALSWNYWLTFDGLSAADQVSVPTLMVHGDGCALPDNARSVYERLNGPKTLVWAEGGQTHFYDQPAQVALAIDAADAFLKGAA
jgi:fermentation-respiration switch protein FrsA (DUF1100 family)